MHVFPIISVLRRGVRNPERKGSPAENGKVWQRNDAARQICTLQRGNLVAIVQIRRGKSQESQTIWKFAPGPLSLLDQFIGKRA